MKLTNGTMKTFVVALAALLSACGNSPERCARAKEKALRVIDEGRRVYSEAVSLHEEQAKKLDPARLGPIRAKFDKQLERAELELDCKRLAKASAPDLVPVQQALGDVLSPALPSDAVEVATVIDAVAQFYHPNVGTFSGPNPGIPEFCESLRQRIAKMKQDLPAAWEKSKADMTARQAQEQKELDEARAQLALLDEEHRAITGGKPFPAASRTSDNELPTELKEYEAACR